MNVYLATLIGYSVVLVGVGLLVGRKVKSASDFLVGGRRFGPGRIFATFLAANIGAGSTVGASGLGYRFGLSAWWWVGSAAIGTFFLATAVGPKLWQLASAHQLHTLGDFWEFRYSKAVKAVIAVLLWLGTLSILAGQLIAISWILNVVIGLPKWQGCLAGGLVAVIYCSAGGLASATIVNMIELAVTMTGLLISLPFAIETLGGWQAFLDRLSVHAGPARAAELLSFTAVGGKQILAYVAILVPSFIVSPGLVQKLYGAKNAATVRRGVGLNSLAQFAFAIVPPLFGLLALSRFPDLENPELALPTVMMKMLPKWLGLWALASIFSAELSATDAILFMLSTSLAVDLYKTFLNPGVAQRRLLAVSRLTAVIAGTAGVALAIVLPSIISAVTIFYSLLAVALFVPVIFGLYWRRMSTGAALACIFAAVAVTALLTYGTTGKGVGFFSPPAAGIAVALVVAVLVSRYRVSA
ncbi:MAG: sodium:solute symporter family protein [Acidobacteria bacterium]|nr:sodium:solute symporter family protein [Acidobacteriota bacterium]